jgi:hypothetical protein
MGAWGTGIFENDDASDWVWELEDDDTGSVIVDALSAVVDTPLEDLVEAPEACNALAAAEVVASASGKTVSALPGEATEWIGRNSGLVDATLIALARNAVDRIAINSELKDLWDEAGDTEWEQVVNGLRTRLGT